MAKSASSSAARRDLRAGAEGLGQPVRHDVRDAQALGVDVVQPDVAVRQLGKAEYIAQQVAGEDSAAGAKKRDDGHALLLLIEPSILEA
jgi:hypothetical protein